MVRKPQPLEQAFNVKKSEVANGMIIHSDTAIRHDSVTQAIRKELSREDSLKKHAIQPSKKLEKAIAVARDTIHDIQRQFGIQETDSDLMRVLLLPEKTYVDANFTGLAVASYPDAAVFLRYLDIYPEYYWGAIVFHEFQHRWLELVSSSYYSNEQDHGTFLTLSIRRLGILSRVLKKSGSTLSGSIMRGRFINELGNYAWQKNFQEKLLVLPEFDSENTTRAMQIRKLLLLGYLKDGKTDCITNFNRYTLRISNIHFDKSGRVITDAAPVIAEYIDTLSDLVGKIDGETLEDLLLKQKVDPKLQNKLRKALDAVFGDGYYEKLRKAEDVGTNIFPLLAEAQALLKQKRKN